MQVDLKIEIVLFVKRIPYISKQTSEWNINQFIRCLLPSFNNANWQFECRPELPFTLCR